MLQSALWLQIHQTLSIHDLEVADMIRQYELVERVLKYDPQADEELLNRAYIYAMRAHGMQRRASGDLFFSHPLEVASILADLKLDDATIAAAILHDTVEDTKATQEEINTLFGSEIGALVDGLTKIERLDFVSKQTSHAENLRKLLLAITQDIRVLLIKLADRLHNMRTLEHMAPEKRQRIAEETLDIYAPLAGRMGIHEIQDELQDLSFRVLRPDACATITQKLDALMETHGKLLETIAREFTHHLEAFGIPAKVRGRRKRPYSIWRKMEHNLISFEQLSDIVGFRVVVDTVDNCYRALGVAHTTWPLVPGRLKDYISLPKQNDYRSLHTTVVGPKNQRVEFQIRTEEMNRIAEYGIAAHVLYKEGHKSGNLAILARESQAYQWLRSTITLLAEGENPEEFLEHTKLELFTDQVFCFTPKGRLIALPQAATPIDFAYAVHTSIGNTAVGCKINGQIASLLSALQNGDEVEILRSDSQTPPAAWEGLVRTGKARSAIRRATRAAAAQQYGALGSHVLERTFVRSGHRFSLDAITAALPRLAYGSLEELLTAVGRGEVTSTDVMHAVYPDYKAEEKNGKKRKQNWLSTSQNLGRKLLGLSGSKKESNDPNALPIRGVNYDLPVRFAPHCGAVPGDRIVGILTPGSEITVYPIQSQTLAQFENEPDRWIDLRWDIDSSDNSSRFPAQIFLNTINEPGSLAAVALAIAENDSNIDNIAMTRRTSDMTDMIIDLSVRDLHHLNVVIQQLRALPMTSHVKRLIR